MTVSVEVIKRTVVVGVRIDGPSRELINWAIVKVAQPGDTIVAVYICGTSDLVLKEKPLLDDYLEVYRDLCDVKKVDLTGRVLKGSSIRKAFVREAKSCSAVTVVVGISRPSALGGWTSIARHCAKKLPSTTEVLAIHNGKIVFRRCSQNQIPGFVIGDPRPSFDLMGNHSQSDVHSEFGSSDSLEISKLSSQLESKHGSRDSRDENFVVACEHKKTPSMSTFVIEDVNEESLGWPLLRTSSSVTPRALHARKMTVVQWVMTLPNRSPPETPPKTDDNSFDGSNRNSVNEFEKLVKSNFYSCRWFSRDELEISTSQFSSENLIGKGGCSRVYKGILADGKLVAVKISKSSKEAWNDFALELDIISSLNHERITPLLGVCVEDTELISVYDFLSKGSLQDNLHGNKNETSVVPWEVRFRVAVGVADAINHLHNECSRPVIHRDVKSSNILLSDGFEPQLSDFGLAMWGPTTSSYFTHQDVVGTFGYLAPEYFMYGKVSDKVDVYSFGVVLLELLSGRKPIGSEAAKGEESLVMWAKPMLESGDIRGILDPDLDGEYDEVQMKRMVLAATLCIAQRARLRPKMSQILKLLRGEKDYDKWLNSQSNEVENQEENDDEFYPGSSVESHLSVALLDVEEDSNSFSSSDKSNCHTLEDFFRGRWSHSSSFD